LITHPKSFAALKEEAQLTFDLAIMVAHADLWLKHSMKALDKTGEMLFKDEISAQARATFQE